MAAIIIAAAYKIYKVYFSKAAKACKGKKGEEKKTCMKDYKVKAMQAEIKGMQTLMKECNKSKDPNKCKTKIQQKIKSKKKKIQGMK